jgi:hypothetical protein
MKIASLVLIRHISERRLGARPRRARSGHISLFNAFRANVRNAVVIQPVNLGHSCRRLYGLKLGASAFGIVEIAARATGKACGIPADGRNDA